VSGQQHTPATLYPRKHLAPNLQEARWVPGLVWTGRKSRPPPGFDPWTVQPVVSSHTDWATRPTLANIYIYLIKTQNVYITWQQGTFESLFHGPRWQYHLIHWGHISCYHSHMRHVKKSDFCHVFFTQPTNTTLHVTVTGLSLTWCDKWCALLDQVIAILHIIMPVHRYLYCDNTETLISCYLTK